MKLYHGGCGNHQEYVVAENLQDAITKIGIKINAPFLPIEANPIEEIDGYVISPVLPGELKPPDKENIEESDEKIRHCKKCDYTCNNQGELLKHYREAHSDKGA